MAADPKSREDELELLEQKHNAFSDACQMRSAMRVAQEIARIARQEQLVVPYLNARFKMMNKARSLLDPELGCEIAVELVALLESEDRARLIQPDLPREDYAQTVAWMSSCAYDNLAVHTANRQGFNSPGMQACINSGLEICRRTGKLQCIACFREYATEVYRAGDDLDMALHSARLVSGQPADAPGSYRRWSGADDEAELLLMKGQLGPALEACQRSLKLAADYHNPNDATRDSGILLETIELLAGLRPPQLDALSPRDLPPGEYDQCDLKWDLRDSLALACAGDLAGAERLLVPWDRRLLSQNCLPDWFELRLRLAALARLQGNDKRLQALANPVREKALVACDWLTLHRLELLLDDALPANPYATVDQLTQGPFALPTPDGRPAAGMESDSPVEPAPRNETADDSGPAGEENDRPESPLAAPLAEFAEELAKSQGDPEVLRRVAQGLLQFGPAEVTHPFDAGWLLHLMQYLVDVAGPPAPVWTWAKQISDPFPQDARVLNTLATLAAAFHRQDLDAPDLPLLEQIAAMYRRSLDLDPTLPRNFARAGAFHLETDNLDEAERCLSRAFRLDRTSAPVAAQLAELYEQSDRPRDALAVLDLALREGCDEPQITWQAAMLAFGLDQYEPLRTYITQYERQRPGEPWTQHYLAIALLELDQLTEARDALAEESRRNPDQPLATEILLACVAGRLQDPVETERQLRLVLSRRLSAATYLTHRGFIGLYGRLWKATRLLGSESPLRAELATLLLQSGLAPDELFEDLAPRGPQRDVDVFRCTLHQPLDDTWRDSPGCLPGQQEWSGYTAVWGVLARNESEAARIALDWQQRCAPLEAEVESIDSANENYRETPRVVWQGVRFVPNDDEQDDDLDDLELDDLDLDDDDDDSDEDDDPESDDDLRRN